MNFDEHAENVSKHIIEIMCECRSIQLRIDQACAKLQFDGETIEYSSGDKQKIIAWYQTRKARLEQLVRELP